MRSRALRIEPRGTRVDPGFLCTWADPMRKNLPRLVRLGLLCPVTCRLSIRWCWWGPCPSRTSRHWALSPRQHQPIPQMFGSSGRSQMTLWPISTLTRRLCVPFMARRLDCRPGGDGRGCCGDCRQYPSLPEVVDLPEALFDLMSDITRIRACADGWRVSSVSAGAGYGSRQVLLAKDSLGHPRL